MLGPGLKLDYQYDTPLAWHPDDREEFAHFVETVRRGDIVDIMTRAGRKRGKYQCVDLTGRETPGDLEGDTRVRVIVHSDNKIYSIYMRSVRPAPILDQLAEVSRARC